MKLFLISQNYNDYYYSYYSAVVSAPDEETAKYVHPDGKSEFPDNWNLEYWCDPDRVYVTYIGEASEDSEIGVVLSSSYNKEQ